MLILLRLERFQNLGTPHISSNDGNENDIIPSIMNIPTEIKRVSEIKALGVVIDLDARYLCLRALGLKAEARATIGYIVYK